MTMAASTCSSWGRTSACGRRRWNGSHWSGWNDRGGGFTSNPAVSTTDVFGIGLDDVLYTGAIPG